MRRIEERMRERKYKAWSKRYTVLCKVEEIHWNTRTINVCYDNKSDWEVTREKWRRRGEPLDEFILMEYTGKKDKNGNEIYEGYIVRDCFVHSDDEDAHYLGPSKKGVVVWNDSHAGFNIETDRWESEMDLLEIVGPTTSHQIMSEWVEVIGTKHENKELVEKK